MADHGCAMSLSQISQSSDEESSEHSPGSFATLSGGDSCIIGGAREYLSLPKHEKPLASTGYCVLSHEPNDQQVFTPSKRPRGRPPGSKNKPKPTLVIKQDNEQSLKLIVIEIPAGKDVVEALIHIARHRRVNISVLSGSGSVSDVTLRHPVSRAPVFPVHGPFTLLSLTGTYILSARFPAPATPPSSSSSNPPPSVTWPDCSSFGICLSGSQGQVFGGVVGGKVVAASLVVVVATLFKKHEFHRVSIRGDAEAEMDDPYAGMNANASDLSGNTNNVMPMSAFSVASSTPLNCQAPADVNVMQWNPSTGPDNY